MISDSSLVTLIEESYAMKLDLLAREDIKNQIPKLSQEQKDALAKIFLQEKEDVKRIKEECKNKKMEIKKRFIEESKTVIEQAKKKTLLKKEKAQDEIDDVEAERILKESI